MKSILIILSILSFSSCGFLRGLATDLTLADPEYSSTCVASFVDGAITFTAAITGTAAASVGAITAKLTDGDKTTPTEPGFTCTALAASAKSLSCTYKADSQVTVGAAKYTLESVTEAASGETAAANGFTVPETPKTSITVNTNYVGLKSTTASTQTINYAKDGPYYFTITYASDLSSTTKPSSVKAGDKEFTACTFDKAVVNCTVTNETLPKDVNYTVTVKNACETYEDTGITVIVIEDADASTRFISFSKVLLLLAGLFLF